MKINDFFQDSKELFQRVLKKGTSRRKIALTLTLGNFIGIIPVIGINTVICFLIAVPFRLNVALIQAANYIVFPVQLALLIPFFKLGRFLFHTDEGKGSITQIVSAMHGDPGMPLYVILKSTMHAVIAWLIISAIFGTIYYFVIYRIIRKNNSNKSPGS